MKVPSEPTVVVTRARDCHDGGERRAARGRRRDVGDVDAVAEDTERGGRRSGQRAGPAGVQQRQLIVVPGDDLLVVPADLDAEVAGRGQARRRRRRRRCCPAGCNGRAWRSRRRTPRPPRRRCPAGWRLPSTTNCVGGEQRPGGGRRAAGSGPRGPGWIPGTAAPAAAQGSPASRVTNTHPPPARAAAWAAGRVICRPYRMPSLVASTGWRMA